MGREKLKRGKLIFNKSIMAIILMDFDMVIAIIKCGMTQGTRQLQLLLECIRVSFSKKAWKKKPC